MGTASEGSEETHPFPVVVGTFHDIMENRFVSIVVAVRAMGAWGSLDPKEVCI